MSRFFLDYREAAAYARNEARRLNHSMGIEHWREYGVGPEGSRVFPLPGPKHRFGFEARCEAVEPGEPLSTQDLEALARLSIEPAPWPPHERKEP